MPPPNPSRAPSRLHLGGLVVIGLACAVQLSAQVLPLERNYPGTGPFECRAQPTPVEPTEDQRVRASQLTSDALQDSRPTATRFAGDLTATDSSETALAWIVSFPHT